MLFINSVYTLIKHLENNYKNNELEIFNYNDKIVVQLTYADTTILVVFEVDTQKNIKK